MSFIEIFNYHSNQRKRVRLDRRFCLFTKHNPKDEVVSTN